MTVGVVVGMRAEAALIPARLGWRVAVAGGTSNDGAERATLRLIAEGATFLLSFGLAGGLSPDLVAGDIVVPWSVTDADGVRHATDPTMREQLGGGASGCLLARSAVIAASADKRQAFADTGCVAVDLESGAVARIASTHCKPFAVLRAVCDPVGRTLPPAALVALDGSLGVIGFSSVLRSILAQPSQIPKLLDLARDAAAARRALVARLRAIS